MNRSVVTGGIAFGLLVALAMSVPAPATAFEIELPGERRASINGFYELRLSAIGPDLPSNGATFSQFRHVLSLDVEAELFPDGFGPFDFMMAYTRWLVTYECIYERGCGLFKGADSFGGDKRDLKRLPRSLGHARSGPQYLGSVFPVQFRTGTLQSPRQRLNPGSDFVGIVNPPGQNSNPNPFAFIANLNNRDTLDSPIDGPLGVSALTRAGAFNNKLYVQLLTAAQSAVNARPQVDPTQLNGTILTDKLRDPQINRGFLRSTVTAGSNAFTRSAARLRGLDGAIARRNLLAQGTEYIRPGGLPPADPNDPMAPVVPIPGYEPIPDGVVAQRNAGLFGNGTDLLSPGGGNQDPNAGPLVGFANVTNARLDVFAVNPGLYDLYEYPDFEGRTELNLITTRIDSNVGLRALEQQAPEVVASQWGALERSDFANTAYQGNINMPLRPFGYLNQDVLDHIDETGSGEVSAIARSFDQIDGIVLAGRGFDTTSSSVSTLRLNTVPGFVGPDGRFATPDDLPFAAAGLTLEAPFGGIWDDINPATGLLKFDQVATVDGLEDLRPGAVDLGGKNLVLFARFNPQHLEELVCTSRGGTLSGLGGDCTLPDTTVIANPELQRLGCAQEAGPDSEGLGFNADGDCIQLNILTGTFGGGVHPDLIEPLARRSLRPADAILEPAVGTDFLNQARFGRSAPARPTSPAAGLAGFQSVGLQKLTAENHSLVSNLDLDFTEDELRWGHGASEDEHEFKEGYLEFEMFDSQLFARVGKLLMVWGKTELFRNQDRLNPTDLSNGVITRLEESRVGQWAAQFVISPESLMRVGPAEDLRLELAMIFDDFEPQDLGKCGEGGGIPLVCLKAFGAYAHGLSGIGLVGEVRPDKEYNLLKSTDFAVRLEGRWNRFTFAVTDFWGWDDAFVIEVINQYERRVDPFTGAPVRATGGGSCTYRAAGGGTTTDVTLSVGPDGDPRTTADNVMATAGNCLLWDPDPTNPTKDVLRAPSSIAASHSVNQQLFHTLCTFTFDPDSGFCAFDRLNNPSQFKLASQAVGGVGIVADVVLRGIDTIELEQNRGTETIRNPNDVLFVQIIPEGSPQDQGELALAFTPEEGALLGCGPAYAAPCGTFDTNVGNFPGVPAGFLSGVQGNGNINEEIDPNNFDSVIHHDRSAYRALGFDDTVTSDQIPGGIDFLNADAGVIGQDAVLLKTATPGALIGAAPTSPGNGDLRWAAGIQIGGMRARALEADFGLTALDFARLDLSQRADLLEDTFGEGYFGVERLPGDPNNPADVAANLMAGQLVRSEHAIEATDGWIEPLPWAVDPNALAQGLILYQVADQLELDPRCDPSVTPDGSVRAQVGGVPVYTPVELAYCRGRNLNWSPASAFGRAIFNDPTDPTNPANVFIDDYLRVGESCSAFIRTLSPVGTTSFDEGCSQLERFSANLERFFSVLEIIGGDQIFDAPETFDELRAMLDGNFATRALGDPIAGRDGIFVRNARVFRADQDDFQTVRNELGEPVFSPPGIDFLDPNQAGLTLGERLSAANGGAAVSAQDFFDTFASHQDCAQACYLKVGVDIDRIRASVEFVDRVAALPVAFPARILSGGQGFFPNGSNIRINLAELEMNDPLTFSNLISGLEQQVGVNIRNPAGEITKLTFGVRLTPSASGRQGQIERLFTQNLNRDVGSSDATRQVRDLDEDQDGVYDGLDDYTPGPVSDDNILCGSGLPGDLLQNAIQFDPYSDAELAKARAAFGDDLSGLPFRSPTGCNGINGLLSASGISLPHLRAGGDGTYGRREFLWQNGQQLILNYQKRNVMGFALDFAEDTTRTSWGIEFSWIADTLIGNSDTPSGLSSTDDFVLSVSVDRPTFFNFINPNRSFFINFQFFLRYISDFQGGRDDRNGNYGVAEGPFSGLVTLTWFTGYFQDRLSPRNTLVFDPTTNTGAVLWGLGYRFSGNFTTQLNVSHFYGDPARTRRALFPILLNGNDRIFNGEGRASLAAVRNQDQANFTLRYSW